MLDNSTPTATAITFLKAIKVHAADEMREICHPDATACLIRQGKPIHITIERILEWVAKDDGTVQDEVSHDEVEQCDDDFATVWTPYNFYVNGEVR
jgi:hypothetical protein